MGEANDAENLEREIRSLSDRLKLLQEELEHADAVLEAARSFGSEQAARAEEMRRVLDEFRQTRLFRYSAPMRAVYARARRTLGRLKRRLRL